MSWVLLYIPDFILTPAFCCFLLVFALSKDETLRTPFFKFFIVTGICGLSTVVTHILMNRVIWTARFSWMPHTLLVINQSGMMSAVIGKFFIALHRYFVLRHVAVNEMVWSKSIVRVLIVIQILIPFLITCACFYFGYAVTYNLDSNGTVSVNLAGQGQIIQKYISNALSVVYVIICIILTYLSSRKLSELRVRLEGPSKMLILRQQKNMFVVVAVCSLSHILKAGQQSLLIIYSLQCSIDRSVYETLLWPTFVATNGLATYAPPIILIFCSRRIRILLFGRFAKAGTHGSEFTVNTLMIKTH